MTDLRTVGGQWRETPRRTLQYLGWLLEVAPDTYLPISRKLEATHLFVQTVDGIEVAPLGTDTGGLRTLVSGDTFSFHGGT